MVMSRKSFVLMATIDTLWCRIVGGKARGIDGATKVHPCGAAKRQQTCSPARERRVVVVLNSGPNGAKEVGESFAPPALASLRLVKPGLTPGPKL